MSAQTATPFSKRHGRWQRDPHQRPTAGAAAICRGALPVDVNRAICQHLPAATRWTIDVDVSVCRRTTIKTKAGPQNLLNPHNPHVLLPLPSTATNTTRRRTRGRHKLSTDFHSTIPLGHEQPLVVPQLMHLWHEPLGTMIEPHSAQVGASDRAMKLKEGRPLPFPLLLPFPLV